MTVHRGGSASTTCSPADPGARLPFFLQEGDESEIRMCVCVHVRAHACARVHTPRSFGFSCFQLMHVTNMPTDISRRFLCHYPREPEQSLEPARGGDPVCDEGQVQALLGQLVYRGLCRETALLLAKRQASPGQQTQQGQAAWGTATHSSGPRNGNCGSCRPVTGRTTGDARPAAAARGPCPA